MSAGEGDESDAPPDAEVGADDFGLVVRGDHGRYALIIGGIAIVVIAGILILGPAIRDLFDETGDSGQQLPEAS